MLLDETINNQAEAIVHLTRQNASLDQINATLRCELDEMNAENQQLTIDNAELEETIKDFHEDILYLLSKFRYIRDRTGEKFETTNVVDIFNRDDFERIADMKSRYVPSVEDDSIEWVEATE